MEINRVFSGVQPSGELHLGNYLGALRQFISFQDDYNCLFCIVDLHAITIWQDPNLLVQQTRDIAAVFLACGLDPKKAVIYPQSQVRTHTELAWILNCVAKIGWLNRMTQFKEKAGKDKEKASVGLYAYPVLQTADILAFKATHIPVGEDQRQHLELTRDIAQKFNHDFNQPDFFPLPQALIKNTGARVMNLRDGSRKMSKSDPSDFSRINLSDCSDMIIKKIKKAKTDSEALPETIASLGKRPEANNLVEIYAILSQCSKQEVLNEHAGKGFGFFKPLLAEKLIEVLSPIRQSIYRYKQDLGELNRILKTGSEKALEISNPVLEDVKKHVGLISF